jgi:hypothetical protein
MQIETLLGFAPRTPTGDQGALQAVALLTLAVLFPKGLGD